MSNPGVSNPGVSNLGEADPDDPFAPIPDAVHLTPDPTNPGIALIRTQGQTAATLIRDIPGATWNNHNNHWRLPITHRAATALRAALTTTTAAIYLDPALRDPLRTAADSTPTPDITLGSGDAITVRTDWTRPLQDDIQRIPGYTLIGPGHWTLPTTQAPAALHLASKHNLAVHPDVTTAGQELIAPFDYDGTLEGLRGVPTGELAFVAGQPARGKRASLKDRLAELGLVSALDIARHVPLRYLDRTKTTSIGLLAPLAGQEVGLIATVKSIGQYDRMRRLTRIEIQDRTGTVSVTFFNQPWIGKRFALKEEVILWGRVEVRESNGRTYTGFTGPILDPVGDGPDAAALVLPVYPQSPKNQVSTWDIHGAAMETVRRLGTLADPVPEDLRTRLNLMPRQQAFVQVHNPDTVEQAAEARRRLAFDELLSMQLLLGMRRWAAAEDQGVVHSPTGVMAAQVLASLPYGLTGAQTRAVAEITADIGQPHPMHRLLQGDVGSGKTLVAALTLCAALEGGYQTALMAPTEILASQLNVGMEEVLGPLRKPDGTPIQVRFLASKTKMKEKREIVAGLAEGSIDVVVGTHALLSDDVDFANLGLVVIDEQHRFGVEQRSALRAKGPRLPDDRRAIPDMLVMTATPIPRTQAMTAFGDLTLSVLSELPTGRIPIATSWLPESPPLDTLVGAPWDTVVDEVAKGRQAYVVASLVEDNETIAAKSCTDAFESLQAGALTGLRLGMVHGKQNRAERDETMLAFKRGEIDVLIATTVIEVGVNVPNATVMVILDATRFGIAQLHQIRGRVGRGTHASYCILTGEAKSADAVTRMKALCDSTDGFVLAEIDLDLRGAGSIMGARQSGLSDLRVADLKTDKDLLVQARDEAARILDNDHSLNRRPALRSEVVGALGTDAAEWLAKS